jgi:prepilin-type N-terminal cleavage/methylation domain-containing protein
MDQLISSARPASRRSGFTLLEVVVAMGILATGLLAVTAAQIYAMRGGSTGRHTTDAASIAHSQIEQFQRMNFTDAALNQTAGWIAGTLVAGGQIQTTVQANPAALVEETYTIQYRVTDVTPGQLKAVDVRVTWNEPTRPNRTMIISTVLHNDPRTSS